MAYACPRCGKDVQRGKSSMAGVAGGLVGALVYSAFASFQCESCGKIATSEFPPEIRNKATLSSLAMVAGAILLFVLVIALLVYLKS
jgi:predicted RNA-binding Zn-ribbon protein involved in translation (DUF1610 family)